MSFARSRSSVAQRGLALLAAAALAALPMATVAVIAMPTPVAADTPIAPLFGGSHTQDLLEIANAGIVDLTQPPASGPANPDPGSVTAQAGGSALQSASILKTDLTGSQLAATTLVSLRLESLPIQLPLSSMPLTRSVAPTSWTDVLAGTPLAGIPQVNVTWSQVIALGPAMPGVVKTLTLADVDWSGSALADLPLAALTFGGQDITTVNLPLQPGEPPTETTYAEHWCYLFNKLQANVCASAASLAGKTLISLGVQGAPLRNIPLRNIPLRNIDLSSSPLRNIPLRNIALQIAPLRNIPLRNIDMVNAPLRNIPLRNILLDAAGNPTASPLRNIPLRNIAWATSPLRNIPLRNIDLAASGLGAIPLRNIDFGTAPLRNIPLRNIDLASTPLRNIPLLSIAASGAPLRNIPLRNIDFGTAPLRNIPLRNINLTASGLGATPLSALNWTSAGLAQASLSQFTLASGPLSTIAIASLRSPASVVACAATSTCPTGATIGSLAGSILPGATLGNIGATAFGGLTLSDLLGARIAGSTVDPALGDLRLDLAGPSVPSLTIGGIVLNLLDTGSGVPNPVLGDLAIPSMSVSPVLGDLGLGGLADTGMTVSSLLAAMVAGSPDLLLGDLSINTLAIGAPTITLAAFLATLSSSQPGVTVGDLRLDTATGVDALVLNAITGFLLSPTSLAGYLLGALNTWTDASGHDITLGELGTWTLASGADITLGDLAQYLDDSVSLADVLLGLVPASQFPYENFPISSLGLSAVGRSIFEPMGGFNMPGSGGFGASLAVNPVSSISIQFDDPYPFAPTTPADFAFTLPPGATPGSVGTSIDPNPAGVTTSTNASGQTVVTVPNVSVPVNGRVSFFVSWTNGIRLGSAGIHIDVTVHGTGAPLVSGDYPILPVQDGSEPNTPQEAIADGFGSPAALRVPNLPTNPNGCSSANASCTGRDSVYVDALAPGYINTPGDVDWFGVQHVKAGSRITADLSNLPVSADLVIYGPAGLKTSPTLFPSAAQGLPGALVEDPGLGVGQAAHALAVNRLNDVWLDPGYNDPVLAQVGAPDSQFAPLTPLSVAQASGTDPEGAGVIAPVDGDYVVQVGGYGRATANDPYLLRVRVTSPTTEASCPARVFANPMPAVSSSVPTIGAGVNTLILTNPSRLAATFGAPAAVSVGDALTGAGGLVPWLATHGAVGVSAAVVPLDAYAPVQSAYQAWDANPCSVSSANAVASQITKVVADIRATHPGIGYVTIVGGDDIVPMGRTSDLTRVSNESEYASTFAASPNPLSAAQAAGFTVTDDVYGDPSPTPIGNGSSLFVPTMAVGRLVETPVDITNQIAKFTASSGTLDTSTGLVTGYDFLADGASAVAARLSVGGRQIDAQLIDTPGSGATPWTTADLLARLFPSGGVTPLVDSINAHYDHTALLSDAGNVSGGADVETATDLASRAGATSLAGRLLFTMGCHAGLAVPDAYISASDPAAAKLRSDWAQTLSAAGVAVYVANTGYGIGDTSSVAYSERLMGLYAKLLDGSLTAGQALVYAKQAYFGSLGAVGVYDVKILEQAAFYGLPFWHVATAPGQTPPVPAPPTLPGTIATDPATGLDAMSLAVNPSFSQIPSAATGKTPRYWTTGTDDPQVTQFQPIEPKTSMSVVTAGKTAHGALITALTSHDVTGVVPIVNTPTVDATSTFPQVRADSAAWPAKLATITSSEAPYGRAQSLVLVPGQFVGSTYDGTGVQRLFDGVGLTVFYAPDASTDFTAPVISGVAGSASGATATFGASASDGTSVAEVVVGYRDLDGAWRFATMLATGSGGYSATVTLSRPVGSSDLVPFFIQAVDGAGNVGVSAGKADGFAAAAADSVPPTITATIGPAPNANGWIKASAATVTFSCSDGGSGVDPAACPAARTVTAQGTTPVSATTVDRAGNTSSVDAVVRLDGNGPSVTASVSPAGWSSAASATVTFACSDGTSGLDASGCPTPQTVSTEGATTVSGTATDLAGNATTATATVRLDRTAPSITAAVIPAPNAAGWSKGTAGTVTFTCVDAMSGVASCPAAVPVTEGVRTVGGTATDAAGNASSISVTVELDGGKPTITSQVTPAPGASGWTKAASVSVGFACADGLSGVATCTAPGQVTAEGTTTVTGTAVDLAGNSASVTATVKIDRTPPVVKVVLSAVPVTASCSTSDALSGVATSATLTQSTARVNGVPVTTATCSGATDVAGNAAAPVTATFTAPMKFLGFLLTVANPPYVNVGRAGWAYPVIFGLKDAQGTPITALSAVTSTTYQAVACSSLPSQTVSLPGTSSSGSGLVNDPTTKLYAYLWKTPAAVGCYQFQLTLADKSVHAANFKLVK